MMQALNKKAWDTTRYISWTFMDNHHFVWDKKRNFVKVKWENYKILISPDLKKGQVIAPKDIKKSKEQELIKKAHSYFYNDSFWLCAPYKIFDPGTKRELVKTEEGKKALLVTYTKGGDTPGDSYLWFKGENGKPEKVKMWVSIIPVGGMEFTWENYKKMYSGAKIALDHKGALFNIEINNLKAGSTFKEIGLKEDPFKRFE